jgi:hypothetical protein
VGSADIEGLGVPEVLEVADDPGDGLVEEQGVGGVQSHRDVGGRRTAVVVEPDAALGEGFLLLGDGAVGVEVEPGLLHESGGLHLTDLGRCGGDQPVREQRCLDAEVNGLPGDQPGPPDWDLSGPD